MTYCFHLVPKSTGHKIKKGRPLAGEMALGGVGTPASSHVPPLSSPPAAVPQTHLRQDSPNAPRCPHDGTLAREPSLTSTLAMKSAHGEDTATST